MIHAAYSICPECGYAFPPPKREQHDHEASTASVLSGEVTETEHEVEGVYYSVHVKRDAPEDHPRTMRVDYRVGFNDYRSEWVCFEHTGYKPRTTDTPGADVSSGDVVVQGDLVGVAKLDIKTGKLGALAVTGVFDFPKATGTSSAIAAGAKVYWNATDGVAGTAADDGETPPTTYLYIGKVVKAAVDADALVRVRLSQ